MVGGLVRRDIMGTDRSKGCVVLAIAIAMAMEWNGSSEDEMGIVE